MSTGYEMTAMTNQSKQFYPVIGPYLANREVHKALGGVPWDEDGKTWIAATAGGNLAGFVGLRPGRGLVHVESLYTLPGHEDATGPLLAAAMEQAHPSPLHAVVRRERAQEHLAAGFTVVEEKTNFLTLAKGGAK